MYSLIINNKHIFYINNKRRKWDLYWFRGSTLHIDLCVYLLFRPTLHLNHHLINKHVTCLHYNSSFNYTVSCYSHFATYSIKTDWNPSDKSQPYKHDDEDLFRVLTGFRFNLYPPAVILRWVINTYQEIMSFQGLLKRFSRCEIITRNTHTSGVRRDHSAASAVWWVTDPNTRRCNSALYRRI